MNPNWYEIAASTNPSLRVIAGPGTGKSFAMKRRVARLLEEGVDPASILPVTFTRIAAEDLHRELVGMGVEGCEALKGMTLHSLAFRVLMRNHVLQATGRTPRPLNNFEIKVLEADLKSNHGGVKKMRKKMTAYQSAWARLQVHEPGYTASTEDRAFATDLENWMLFHRAMLIGEVIPQFYEYLRSNPAAPERTEYSHILVDEYQDLNKAEQGVIHFLSDEADVCIVGDDDQSIYSFKYAHPEGIRDWHIVRQGAHDLTLGDCRRCPTTVTAMANSLIAHNQNRPQQRSLTPVNQNGDGDVRIVQYNTLQDEVKGIADIVYNLIEGGYDPGDVLVLAQRGAIGTPIFEELMNREIPVKSYYAEAELDAEDDRAGALGFGLNVEPPAPRRSFSRSLDLEKLQQIAKAINDDETDIITDQADARQVQELLLEGTSMGGARPKAVVEDDNSLWIAKFTSPGDKWSQLPL